MVARTHWAPTGRAINTQGLGVEGPQGKQTWKEFRANLCWVSVADDIFSRMAANWTFFVMTAVQKYWYLAGNSLKC